MDPTETNPNPTETNPNPAGGPNNPEPEPNPGPADPTNGGGPTPNPGPTNPPKTLDDILKENPAMQAEFDRRISKGINTAKERWQRSLDEAASEAEKLANMSETQKQEYKLQKAKKELEQRQAEFERKMLGVQTGAQLQQMGYDAGFSKYVTGNTAEETNRNLTEFDKLMAAYRKSVVKDEMRGSGAPKEPEKPGINLSDVKNMTPEEINKLWDNGGLQEALSQKKG